MRRIIRAAPEARAIPRTPTPFFEVGLGDADYLRRLKNARSASHREASETSAVEMVAGVGIEPTTRGFSIRCSTN